MAAVVALAAVLTLGACRATGGGYLPPGGASLFQARANFGFNFTCEVETAKKRAVVRGTITYHDDPSPLFPKGIRINGTVDPFFIQLIEPVGVDTTCDEADVLAGIPGDPYARFAGKYRSQDTTIPAAQVRAGSRSTWRTWASRHRVLRGTRSTSTLTGGYYGGYNRFGFVEGGNIQVENN